MPAAGWLLRVKILGVETSCDETAAAVVRDGNEILSNVVSSQIDLHRPYGGVVPELAARNHLELIEPVIRQALQDSNTPPSEIDAVAATYGPGLASSLVIGLSAAKGIALAGGKPFIAINHLEAHLYSPIVAALAERGRDQNGPRLASAATAFPLVSLIVSGGHTILAYATGFGQHEILGQTLDDAAGEAFDKVAKLLGLGYPGGPEIEKRARHGNPAAIDFPRGMLDEPGYNFSFSGLKTSVLYYVRKHPVGVEAAVPSGTSLGIAAGTAAATPAIADICASFQEAAVDVLVGKTVRAAAQYKVKTVSASGGVSVNARFREKLAAECRAGGLELLLAPPKLCTDNAAMIAALAFHKLTGAEASASADRGSRGGYNDFSIDVAPSIGLGGAT